MQSLFAQGEPCVFRKRISTYFGKLVKNETIGENIELSIFNYTIQDAAFRQIIKKWTNPKFCELYSARLKTMIYNLKKEDLLERIKSNQVTAKMLASMTHQEMLPEKWRARMEMKTQRDKSKLSTNIEASTDLFTCKKCRSKKCTYYELQTRSADEPATIFITCLDCGKNWKN
jgi:DNA-directed RNA polymerase subunit M/transcription elongation factor TFIIS